MAAQRARTALLCVLAAGAGASDAFSFVALGHVFTSVITGSLVIVGMSISDGDLATVADIAIALACYVLATGLAARLLTDRVREHAAWSPAITRILLVQALVQAGVLAGWVAGGSHAPGVPLREILLGGCALAMGVQSAAVRAVPGTGLSTTYLTGTLTALVATVVTRDRSGGHGDREGWVAGAAVIGALLVGATVGALLLRWVPALGALLPLLCTASVAGLTLRWSAAS